MIGYGFGTTWWNGSYPELFAEFDKLRAIRAKQPKVTLAEARAQVAQHQAQIIERERERLATQESPRLKQDPEYMKYYGHNIAHENCRGVGRFPRP